MNVTLRQREKGNKISLYLDYYNEGKRTYEYLQLYLLPETNKSKLTKEQKELNRKTLTLAEAIRSKRFLQVKNEEFGFRDTEKVKGSFVTYFELLAEEREKTFVSLDGWKSALVHVRRFSRKGLTIKEIDKNWLEDFKTYMRTKAGNQKTGKLLSKNSQCTYYRKVVASLNEAVKQGIILANPSIHVTGLKPENTNREFLSIEELRSLINVECDMPELKSAFIFSALTGLRWSDIQKLKWSEVQHSVQAGYSLRYRQKKTKEAETLPISEQAYKILGQSGEPDEYIFRGLAFMQPQNRRLREWLKKAGITKHISFHCARHTFATLQISLGTDIYTVSKLLGHRNVQTTEIYAKVIDLKKQEAASRIRL
jgi:integrase